MHLIEQLLILPWLYLIILLLVAFFGWLFLVKIFSLHDRFWRISNFCALLLTCLGILGMVKDTRQIFYEREYYKCHMRIESVYRWRMISNFNEDIYCRVFIENEYSPGNLNAMQGDYDLTYRWIKKYKEYFFECYSNQKLINTDSISYPKLQASDPILERYFNDMRKCVTDYNNDIEELREYKRGLQPNIYELYYIVLSPLFLAIGLGWEFVKFFAKR